MKDSCPKGFSTGYGLFRPARFMSVFRKGTLFYLVNFRINSH